jgi:hypothetical protein
MVLNEHVEGRPVRADISGSGDMRVTISLGEDAPGESIIALPPRSAGTPVEIEEEDRAEMEMALCHEGFSASSIASTKASITRSGLFSRSLAPARRKQACLAAIHALDKAPYRASERRREIIFAASFSHSQGQQLIHLVALQRCELECDVSEQNWPDGAPVQKLAKAGCCES